MVKKIFLTTCIFLSLLAHAQVKEGRMIYERVIQTPTRVFTADPEIARQIPRSRTDQFELLFSQNNSLWQYLPNANAEDASTITAPGMMIRFQGGANDVSFVDFEKENRIDQREVMDRNFIVTDTIAKLQWKMSEEVKTILNFKAYKATATRISTRQRVSMENGQMKREEMPDTATIIAWFTPDIPVPAGPDFQKQLPGMILELDINNGQTVYKAIEFLPKVNVAKIKEPKGGKKMTAAEFIKERDKLTEEMRRNMPAGNVIRMN